LLLGTEGIAISQTKQPTPGIIALRADMQLAQKIGIIQKFIETDYYGGRKIPVCMPYDGGISGVPRAWKDADLSNQSLPAFRTNIKGQPPRVSGADWINNENSTYLDGGLLFTGFSEAHPNDKFGIAATYARISDSARARDRDVQIFTGTPYPIRDYEAILEITYQHEVRLGFLLQPVFQYIAHPGGGAVDPNDPTQTRRIKDGVMAGVRTTITY